MHRTESLSRYMHRQYSGCVQVVRASRRIGDKSTKRWSSNFYKKGRIAAAYGHFSHVRQVAPICTPSRCSMAHPRPQPIRHVDRFSGFCKAHDRDRQTDRSRHRQYLQSIRPNYGRPIEQGRPLYFCPVVSSIFFFFFLLSNRKSHSNRK